MKNVWKPTRTIVEIRYAGKDILREIELTIAELEIYLEANPEDEIAQAQYGQFVSKRENMTAMMADCRSKLPHPKLKHDPINTLRARFQN